MFRIFNNKEFRHIIVRLLLIQSIIAILICVLYSAFMKDVKGKVTDQSAALIGKVVMEYPELEKDIVGVVAREAKKSDARLGYSILSRYGYADSTPFNNHPVFKNTYFIGLLYVFGFILLSTILLYILITLGYNQIYKKVGDISAAAERVVEGDYDLKLSSGYEGEFEILGHRFNQMADRLKHSIDRLMEEKVFLQNTISDISHQLKTPLSTLILNNEIMTNDTKMDQGTRESFLDTSRQQLDRLEWLIHGLLKVARLEAGSIQFKNDNISLKETVSDAVETLYAMAKEAAVSVCISDNSANSNINGDKEWLCEAFINIVKNCIEHTGHGGKVNISLISTPLSCGVIISDNGEGIDRKDLPHIFERFYKGVHSTKPNSIGIGLALSKAIIEGHGGSITVKSEKDNGTEFTVTFIKTITMGL